MLSDFVKRFENVKRDSITPKNPKATKEKPASLLKVKRVKIKAGEDELGKLAEADVRVKSKIAKNDLLMLDEMLSHALDCGYSRLAQSPEFIDQEFPPAQKSLYGVGDMNQSFDGNLRIEDGMSDWEKMGDTSMGVCSQISLSCVPYDARSTSNISSVLTALCIKPARILSLFKSLPIRRSKISLEFFTLNLFVYGRSETIVLDKYFPKHPLQNAELCYLQAHKGCIWPLILQKAMAKIMGSYSALQKLDPQDIFKIFTGAPVARIDPSDIKNRDIVLEAARKGWPMVAKLKDNAEMSTSMLRHPKDESKANVLVSLEIFDAVLGIANYFDNDSKSMKTVVILRCMTENSHTDKIGTPFPTKKTVIPSNPHSHTSPHTPTPPSVIQLSYSQFASRYTEVTVCLHDDRHAHSCVTEVGLKSLHMLAVDRPGNYYVQAVVACPVSADTESMTLALVLVQRVFGGSDLRLKYLSSTVGKNGVVMLEEELVPGEYVLFTDIDSAEPIEYCVSTYGPGKVQFQDIWKILFSVSSTPFW